MRMRNVALWALMLLVAIPGSAIASSELLIWDYVPWRVEYYQQYADEYMKLNPDVKVEVQYVLQAEYVDKIKVAMVTGTAPAMFAGHPTWIGDFNGLLAPFPHDLFPPEELSQELLGYSQLLQDGYAYYYPLGMQGSLLFINEDHWNNAGIGAPPKTWREAVDIGRRATRVVDGVTTVAGFYFNSGNEMMHDLFIDLNYQYGGTMYRNGGTEVAFDENPALDAVNLIYDMYQTGVSGFGEPLTFPAGQHTMLYSMAWRQQQLITDVRWTVAQLPTLTGEVHPGMMRLDYYFGLAVPENNSPEIKQAAFEFIDWVYSDEGHLMDLNSRSGTLPARMSLWSNPEIVENPVLYTLTQTLPFATPPGEYPQWIKNALNPVRNAIVSGGADPGVLLRDVTRQINARLEEEPIVWVAE